MKAFVIIIYLLLISCGSSKKATNEAMISTSNAVTVTGESMVNTETGTEVTDEYEVVVVTTVTTNYDTNKTDSTGEPVIESKVEKTVIKERGSNKSKQTNTTNNVSATKEENVSGKVESENVVSEAFEENKQMKHAGDLAKGIAFLILAILAFWVFSKYRRR